MIHGLYQSASGMMTQMENHQIIAENLGAAAVPGYRRSVASFESFLPKSAKSDQLTVGAPKESYQSNPSYQITVPNIRASTDFSTGRFEQDGNPTHYAIAGNAFFAVQMPDNSTGYTKNGSFCLNSEGVLSTEDGWPVLSSEGNPISIRKPSLPFDVSESGEVFQEGQPQGKIQMATFANPSKDLKWWGGRFFVPTSDKVEVDTSETGSRLMKGYLESSNVNVVHEMVSMIQAMRLYESNQKMLQAQDSSLEQTIRQVPTR